MKLSPIEPGSDVSDFIIENLDTGEIMSEMDMIRKGIVWQRPHQCGIIMIDGQWIISDYRAG